MVQFWIYIWQVCSLHSFSLAFPLHLCCFVPMLLSISVVFLLRPPLTCIWFEGCHEAEDSQKFLAMIFLIWIYQKSCIPGAVGILGIWYAACALKYHSKASQRVTPLSWYIDTNIDSLVKNVEWRMELHMPWEKQKNTPKKNCANFFLECPNHQKVLGTDPEGPLCSHANANYLEEPMHSIVTWKRLIPSRFPGRMLSRIFDGKHNWKRKAHCEAQWSSSNVCLYDIIGCYLWRKKLWRDIVFYH